MRYTLDHELYYTGYHTILEKYNEANWITLRTKSISGYVFISVELLYYGNLLNKYVSQDPWWNQSLLLLIKFERKLSGYKISYKIFHVSQTSIIYFYPLWQLVCIRRAQINIYNDKFRHICHKYNIIKHLLSNEEFFFFSIIVKFFYIFWV